MASELVRIERSIHKQLSGIKRKSKDRATLSHMVTQACMDKYKLKIKKEKK